MLADESHTKSFVAIHELTAAEKWRQRFNQTWPSYKAWYFKGGDAQRPSYGASIKMLKAHMPELLTTFHTLAELAGGSDSAARFLAHYQPPPYLSGCTQAAWSGSVPALVRNYDYNASRFEATVLTSKWNDQTVIAMLDASWGVLDGINESGLSVSLSFGGRTNVGEGFGVPIILRYLLEFCETTQQAVSVLQRVPSHMSYNITLIDRAQRFATVYITPDKETVVRQNPVATNHQNKIEWPRHAWATATLEREAEVQSTLADPNETLDNLVACFMRPPVFNSSHARGFGTLYTAVYYPHDSSARYIWPQHEWRINLKQPFESEVLVQF